MRRYILRRFPYKLIGLLSSDTLTILAVAHQHQHPAYWKLRHPAYESLEKHRAVGTTTRLAPRTQ